MEWPPINLPIFDWLQQIFAKLGLVGSIFVPMGITAACVVLYFAVKDVKTSRKIAKPEIRSSADTEGMELHGEQQESSTSAAEGHKLKTQTAANGDGHADLEDRLIGALASAPWEVKEGSEIALEKNQNNKWAIATKKIAFVLGRNGDAKRDEQAVPITGNPPEEPQPPAPLEEEEVTEEVA